MIKRKLGFSDLHLTTIGFGAWALGGGNWEWAWGHQDDNESIATIHKALDLGINWIDTAAVYGLGHSELVVGKAIQGHRNQVTIATKCSLVWEEGGNGSTFSQMKAWSIRKEAEDSLRRLNIETIDLYQIHWPSPDKDLEEAWSEIANLIKEGKVRYAGLSNCEVSQIKRCQSIHPVASLQPPYNMLERGIETEVLDFCAQNNIGIVAYSPMVNGLLTGKFSHERLASLPDDDWRRDHGDHFQEPEFSINLDLVEGLSTIAKRNNRSVGELAVAWVLRHPQITSAITGARRPGQIAQIAPAGDWTLSTQDVAEIELLLKQRTERLEQA